MSGPPPLCSIVVPTYNGRDLLRVCLASVERHRPDRLGARAEVPTLEIIVADDGSTDGTAQWLARERPEARLVRLEQNAGFCAAANAGLAAARGRFVQLLNNDTEVLPGWIEAGLAPFADGTVGSVAPLVLVRSDPDRVDSAGDAYAWMGWPSKRGHGQPAARWTALAPEEVFGASGSSAFYRAEALRQTGGFDPIYGSYYEDIDLAFRLRWAGHRCVFAPDCRVLHEVSASYDHQSPALQRRMSRNAEIVFWSNMPAHWLIGAVGPRMAFLGAQALWRLARGRLGPFAAGKFDALRAHAAIRDRRRRRTELARCAIAPPHFALGAGSLEDVRNHLRRPLERSRQTGARST